MSVFRINVWLAALALTLGTAWSAPARAADGETTKIYRLGNPATTISTRDTKTAAELKERVKEYESALQVVLAQSTFDGDPQDFFDAIENDQFEETMVQQGATFPWMSSRKDGNPRLLHNVEWASSKPFIAWRVKVETKSATYHFIIPGTCLNLALESKVDRAPLSCSLGASAAASTVDRLGAIALTGSVKPEGDLEITGIGGPGAVVDASKARAQGAGRWTFQPEKPGTYKFSAMARDPYGREARCAAEATVKAKLAPPKPKPMCQLNVSYDETTGVITADSSGSKGTVTITDLSVPDGATGGLEGGNGRWTVNVDKKVRRRGGEYVFRAQAELDGEVDNCGDSRVNIPVPPGPDHRWIARGFGFGSDGGERRAFEAIGPTGGLEQNSVALDGPTGVGVALEYLFNKRIGIEGAVLIGNADGNVDQDRFDFDPIANTFVPVWIGDDDDVSFTAFTIGVNFHLTPDRRADLYIGPLLGFTQYDDGQFNLGRGGFRVDFDDDSALGAQVGVDVPFKRDGRWGFNSALRYLPSSSEVTNFGVPVGGEDIEIDVDPLLFSAGISIRF